MVYNTTTMEKIYTTKQIAYAIGIHVNTVRFYEDIGFLTTPYRLLNGYRQYSDLHLAQCRLIRVAMRAEVLQNGLRKQAVKIVKACAELDFDKAFFENEKYREMITTEISSAQAAIRIVEQVLKQAEIVLPRNKYKRTEVIKKLNITLDTIRTWERNGLLKTTKKENGHLVYTEIDLERISIIKSLRLANYSLVAIYRLLNSLDNMQRGTVEVEQVLNTPNSNEDIISVCDHLIVALTNTYNDSLEMDQILTNIKNLKI